MNRFQRMVAWDSGGNGGPSSASGFIFNSLLPTQQGSTSPLQQQQPPLFGQSQFFSSRPPSPQRCESTARDPPVQRIAELTRLSATPMSAPPTLTLVARTAITEVAAAMACSGAPASTRLTSS
ncbi:hypothetical protein COP1_018910 [Malus domestica]